jgi:TrmH family RNA methyltransferase
VLADLAVPTPRLQRPVRRRAAWRLRPERLAYTNPKVQRLRRLLGAAVRREEGVVVESALAEVAVQAGHELEAIYVPEGAPPRRGWRRPARRWRPASSSGWRPRNATAPAGRRALPLCRPEVLAGAGFVVVAAGLSDPGNLGTILRTAEAAGADAVVLTPDTVDATNRRSCGRRPAPFLLPVVNHVELGSCGGRSPRLGTSAPPARPTPTPTSPLAGARRRQRGAGWRRAGRRRLTSPRRAAESLNAAMAAARWSLRGRRQRRVQAADHG